MQRNYSNVTIQQFLEVESILTLGSQMLLLVLTLLSIIAANIYQLKKSRIEKIGNGVKYG